ncbi:melanocyte protein PMEL-like isoform X2 [Myxocyprinus asiaticus]|uniref:melanocyte protein PMEL-like isoform X2 n=1 Tax=Myxocyprinus asiaticus TaxID=70543 RepID=UPI002223802B|nr:melanocyte protein PMEL-like isoform X2 [Myxocyprinus asiaticus]
MKLLSRILVLTCFSMVLTRQVDKSNSNSKFNQYQTWNAKLYPVWKDGDLHHKNSWAGGELKFDVSNDAPTLTGAKISFTIDIIFPHNQRVLPNGQVVWAKNCTINGTQFHEGEPIYPEENSADAWNAVFPNAPPLHKQEDEKPPYVFVWKTWGKYWQVCDGPSSSLTISTDGVPLGSYMMDVVIYHYRKRDKFIPIGYVSTQFSITDQIPFAVSLSQVHDKDEGDHTFIQNRAVAFIITLHDPSQYLSKSDVTFNWDFGDGSGTVISRELTVTHTYISSGAFKPQVVIQAVIPDPSCATPPNPPTEANPTTSSFTSENHIQSNWDITTDRAAKQSSDPVVKSTPAFAIKIIPPAPPNEDVGLVQRIEFTLPTRSSQEEQPLGQPNPNPRTSIKIPVSNVATELSNILTTMTKTTQKASAATDSRMLKKDTVQDLAVAIMKRQAPETDNCVIYRYGSFSTEVEVIEGIESVQIVQVAVADGFMLSEMDQNAVDFTVTCQGSLPTEVCTVVSDADCHMPVRTFCNAVRPSTECQLILRHFFNDSGIYCINVSMTNDVSLAVTNARVNINIGSRFTSAGAIVMVLGILTVASVMGSVAFAYKHLKGYHKLTEVPAACQSDGAIVSSMAALFWSLVNQRALSQKLGEV